MKRTLKILLIVIALFLIKCDYKVDKNHDLIKEEKGTVYEQQMAPKIVQANPDSVSALFNEEIIPAKKPQVFQQKGIVKIESGTPGIIKVNRHNIEVREPGKDSIQLPKDVAFVEQKKFYPQPEPIPAMLVSRPENTPYNMVFLDVEQGINTSNITSILEDKRGNVWFASYGAGVSKYDGTSFLHYNTAKGLSHLLVTCIFEDSKGNIWFGTNGGGACKFDGKTFTQITEKEGLINNQVWSIIEDKKGNLWFATRRGICKYDGNSFMYYTEKEGLSSTWIYSIKEDKNGNLWFGTDNGIIIKYDGNSFTNYSGIEGIENHAINSIAEDNNGNLWFGTFGGGVFKFDEKSFSQYTEKEGLSSNNVWDILVDKSGNLWIGTEDAGACKFDGKHFTHFTKNQGLLNNLVRSIMEDSSGNIWLGTYDGATIYNPKSFVHYTINGGLIGDSITSIIEDKSVNMWFGSNGSGVCKYDGNSYTYYTKDDGLSSNNIQSILEDKDGNLWFGTNNSGVNKFNGKTFVRYTEKDGLSSNFINSLLLDKNGDIWLGTYGNGLCKYDGKTFIYYTRSGGLSNNYVWSVIEDDSSNIWISTRYNGVNKYDGETFTHYAKNEGLTNYSIYSMLQDKTGNIWFGTMNMGIVKYDSKDFTHYLEEDGLASNTVFSIVEDKSGNLWLGTDKGLSCFEFIPDPENKDYKSINITNFDKEDGLNDLDFMKNSALLDSKNRLWWGTAKGVTLLDMNEFVLSKEPPIIQLNTIDIEQSFIDYPKLSDAIKTKGNRLAGVKKNINLKKVRFNGVAAFYNYPINLKLPHYINNLTFHFSAINWAAPQKIQYQYFVEGLDKEWRQLTKENSADYRNIPFGSYTFKVKATGIANTWSKTLEYPFTIRPPLWLAWWAYAIYVFATVLIIILIFRWRTSQLKQRQRELEQKVKERTTEIQDKNEELKQQKEELKTINEILEDQKEELQRTLENLKTTQSQLVQSEKMASVGQLVAGIAHEINNPVTFISAGVDSLNTNLEEVRQVLDIYHRITPNNAKEKLKEIEELKEQIDYKQAIREIDKLIESIKTGTERTTQIIKGLRTFSRLDEDVLKVADIHEGLDSTLILLRNKYKNRIEIAKDYGDIPQLECFPGQLNQVFMNILSNAIDAIEYKGIITISTSKSNGSIQINIKDTGRGIQENIKAKIFDPFFTTKEVGEGTGLGLSISHGIIEKHNGSIKVKSEIGKGSEFIILLPVRQEKISIT